MQSKTVGRDFLNIFLGAVVPGAGAFEIATYVMLKREAEKVKGRVKLGVLVRMIHHYRIFLGFC